MAANGDRGPGDRAGLKMNARWQDGRERVRLAGGAHAGGTDMEASGPACGGTARVAAKSGSGLRGAVPADLMAKCRKQPTIG